MRSEDEERMGNGKLGQPTPAKATLVIELMLCASRADMFEQRKGWIEFRKKGIERMRESYEEIDEQGSIRVKLGTLPSSVGSLHR